MLSEEDKLVWNEYVKKVKPLKRRKDSKISSFFSLPHLFLRKQHADLPNTLDLHQMTLDEAFNVFVKFLNIHFNQKTKKITVITGRGKDDRGQLKKEFPMWLENDVFKNKINSFSMKNEGSFEIELRKKC